MLDIHEQQLGYEVNYEDLLIYRERIYVPNWRNLKNLTLDEYHNIPYVGHPGYQKMITALRKKFFWPSMKEEVAEYLAHYLECQQVKEEHHHQKGFLHPIPIPEWKWETISINFITRLPKSKRKNDSIMVVVDKLRKCALFIPVHLTYRGVQIANIFMQNISKLHGVPKMIIFYHDVKFTSAF